MKRTELFEKTKMVSLRLRPNTTWTIAAFVRGQVRGRAGCTTKASLIKVTPGLISTSFKCPPAPLLMYSQFFIFFTILLLADNQNKTLKFIT